MKKYSAEYYQKIEDALRLIVTSVAASLSKDELEDAKVYEYGEYGISLEFLLSVLVEKKIAVSIEVANDIKGLVALMKLEKMYVDLSNNLHISK